MNFNFISLRSVSKFITILIFIIPHLTCYIDKTNKLKNPKIDVSAVSQWTPNLIYNSTNYRNGVVDPENYLDDLESKTKIFNLIDDIKLEKEIDVTLIFISEISSEYLIKQNMKKDINKFVNELSILLVNRDRKDDSNSLIFLFSIKDHQMKIRTGSNVKKVITDNNALDILKGVKHYLQNKLYSLAAVEVLTESYNLIKGYDKTSFYLIILPISLCIIMLCCCCSLKSNEKQRNIEAESKLDKIKEITNRNHGKSCFIEKTCVICLDDLTDEAFKGSSDNGKESTYKEETLNQGTANTHIPLENENKIDEAKCLKQEAHSQNIRGKLDCGHNFHQKCIAEWMGKKNNCPVCRSIIDKDGKTPNEKPLQQGLVEIQSDIHPELNSYNYDYTSGFAYSLGAGYFLYQDNYNQANNPGCDEVGNLGGNDWNNGGGADDGW